MLNAVRDAQEGVACSSYKKGMSILSNSFIDIPDLKELNYKMESHTGWKIMPVDGILGCEDFYKLLSKKIFPSATLVRDWHSYNKFCNLNRSLNFLCKKAFESFNKDLNQSLYSSKQMTRMIFQSKTDSFFTKRHIILEYFFSRFCVVCGKF